MLYLTVLHYCMTVLLNIFWSDEYSVIFDVFLFCIVPHRLWKTKYWTSTRSIERWVMIVYGCEPKKLMVL